MSAFSTLRITRSTAQRALLERLLKPTTDEELAAQLDVGLTRHLYAQSSGATDDELAAMLDELILNRRLYNCTIVPDGAENDDAELDG